jgi:hypothetical protein
MNAQDRQLLDALNLRQQRLEIAVAHLRDDLHLFTNRFATPESVPPPRVTEAAPIQPPPLPEIAAEPPPLPPLPAPMSIVLPEPQPVAPPVVEGPGFEIQFGRWLARIGVVFALLTLVFVSVLAYEKFHQYVGPWSKLTLFTLVSAGFIGGGLWLERKSRDLVVYGRTLAGGGLACLYYTLYGATYVPQLQVIHNVYLGGILLLAWSAGVLVLAERRKSELLSIFAISLAYFSSAITPVGNFTMAADLLLAATAVVFLVRNAWTGLSYLCLIGTYLGYVRQIVVSGPDATGAFLFAHDPALFWPWTIYLTGAWLIFTAGVFLARAPGFEGGKRLAFLSLNNGAWAGLLLVAAQLSGHGHLGGLLLIVGVTLLAACALARLRRAEDADVADAYLWQGLAIATAGLVSVYHGVTRGLILIAESVSLAAVAAYSRNLLLRFAGGGAALLGTAFLLNESIGTEPFPWWLMAAGLAAMTANAWLSRASLARVLYVGLALVFAVRWIYGVVPDDEITLALFVLATALVGGGLLGKSCNFVRAGLVLDLVGCCNYVFAGPDIDVHPFAWLDAGALALFLAQPALLRYWGRELISEGESWTAILISSALAWLFVSNSVTGAGSHNLTLAWALLALALIIIGFVAQERRQRWCGLGILAAAFVRVAVHDFWGFSDGGKVLTFFALTVICLGLSFLYYKFADRLKEWL